MIAASPLKSQEFQRFRAVSGLFPRRSEPGGSRSYYTWRTRVLYEETWPLHERMLRRDSHPSHGFGRGASGTVEAELAVDVGDELRRGARRDARADSRDGGTR